MYTRSVGEHKSQKVKIGLTCQERHKSAPYLRLKNRKKTSKYQVFFTVPEKPKRWTELVR